ncbi:unnamed protein product, partial [Choristocarpus tenellus]
KVRVEARDARLRRRLSILFLGTTRVGGYDRMSNGGRGGRQTGTEVFESTEMLVRDDVDETNMNPLRDTARVLAMESLGHEVRCVSKVS